MSPRGFLSKRRVLAISSDLDQLRRIVANLERAGAEVDAARSVDAIQSSVIPHRYVFAAVPGNGDGMETLDRLRPVLRDKVHVSVIADRAQLAELTQYLHDPRVNHVIV